MHHGDVSPQIARGLLSLKKQINRAKVTSSKLDESINVAVWNIREFGKSDRTPAAIHYIAEILGQFDLVALVELRDDLTDLGRVLPYLGVTWDVVYSDWIEDYGGNKERIAFLFDRRAVTFNGLAAEVDAPRKKVGKEYLAARSFWRAPYMCSFRAGNFDFIAIATHARWGNVAGRKAELQMLSDWIGTRFNDKYVEDHDLIVMGDFNVPKIGDKLFKALTSCGLQIPDVLVDLEEGDRIIGGSNLKETARYDQILHLPTRDKTEPAQDLNKRRITAGGTINFFDRGKCIKELFPDENYTKQQFSFQMSDHFPVWVQVKTDIEGDRFEQIIRNSKKA